MLTHGSHAWKLNEIYNNVIHFSSYHNYDIRDFLNDLKYLIDSKVHTVQVMGGVHTDAYGHTSGMIGQMTDYGEFVPAITKDTYIRFKVVMDPRHFKIMKTLDHFSVFHFLTDVPVVEKLQMHTNMPIVMQELPHSSFTPRSRYARSHIVYIPRQQ
jgi:hypothetical protein